MGLMTDRGAPRVQRIADHHAMSELLVVIREALREPNENGIEARTAG